MKMCPKSGYWISVHRFQSCTKKASVWLQLVRRDFVMLHILNESSTKIPWKVDYLLTAVELKLKKCPKSGYWVSVHRFQSCTMKASVWLQLVRRDFGMLDILNESSTKIPWKVDYLFTAVVLKMKMCPKSGHWISVHRLESCTMKASCWLQLVRRDFGMLDILNESSTKIPRKVDYLFTAVVLKLKKCPKSGYWISVHRLESCTMKASCWLQLVRRDFCMLDILNESSTKISWKVDYLLTVVELKLKKCPKSGYWVSVHRFQSCTMKASVWIQLVRRDFGMLDILNESCTKIPWKVDYLFTAVVLKLKKCPKSGYWILVHRLESWTMKASCWLQLVRRDFGMLDILNESSTKIPWKVDYLLTAVELKLKKCPKSGYWVSVHRFQSCTMKASVWLQLVRRDFGMLDILNESSTKIPWKVDYLFTAVVLRMKMCPKSGHWISVHRLESCTMKASVWLQLVRRDFGMLDILNESSTKIPWKVDYLFTAVVLKMKMCPKSGHWISVHRLESCTMKASCWLQLVRRDFGMLDILNESSTKIPRKVDYLFTAVVLKLKKCPKSGYWISVHRLESCTMKASCWLQLVRRDFCMLDILNESSTKIPWKVDYLLTVVELKLKKCPKSGYWVSVHRFQSCTMKASVWFQLVRRDFGMLDILNESCTKIPWKVDYLFTAVVLKLKKCPKSGYWILVHRLESWTMKASCWLQLVRRDFGMLDILNESSTKIPWKVDYLLTAVELKLKKCPKSGYWVSVHRFQSCTMKASVWLQLVRRDFGMLDILNESSTKIPWKVDYLFTAVVLKMKMCPKSGHWISVHRLESCTMKASVWLQLVRRDFGMLDILNESSTKIPWKVDYLFTAVVLRLMKCPKSGYWISVHWFQSCTMKASVWLQLVRRDFGMLDTLNVSSTKIPWKVDYLFTAVVLKMKMCPKSGHWISVHRLESCTMKASCWLQLVRRDFGMLDILNESSTKIPRKVDYLFTAVVLKLKKCPKSGYWISVHRLESCTMKASCWLQLVRRDFCMLDILNESSTKIPWKVDYLLTAVELKLKKCPKSGYWVSVHRFQSCTMKASVWIQLVRRDFGMLDILNESCTKIPWKVDYLFTAVVLKLKKCPKSGYWILVHRLESWTMKASCWLQLVRRDFGMLDILNEISTKIPWKVVYLLTAVELKLKKCPKSGYWVSVHRFQSCTMKASVWLQLVRRDFGMLDILNESSTKIPWKVDYLFTAVVLKMKMCPKSGHWISVHRLESCTMKASCWLQLVRRDFGMLDILNESSTKIPWKVDYLFTAVVLKLKKCPKSGYWISVHWFESCTMKASVWLQLVRRDFGMLDTLNESSTKIPRKVDYLFTAVVLKLKKCPKSGYWVSVHRLESCTMIASVWLQLVRRDFGMLDILNESCTKIPWKVDYLFTAVELKLKKCPRSGYWISVHRFQSCTMKASVWLQLVRRDFGMLDILNESCTKIPWKVDYLFTAVVLKMKMCPKSGHWISVHRLESCTMKASCWLQLVRRDFGMLDILNESSTKIPWKVDYLFTAVVLKLKKCPKSGYWISVHRFQSCTMKASVWLQLVQRDFGMLDILNESCTVTSVCWMYWMKVVLKSLEK